MRVVTTVAALACAGVALGACNLVIPDKDAQAAADKVVADVTSGADLSKDPQADPGMTTPESLAELSAIREILPPVKPTSVKQTGWTINAHAGAPTVAEIDSTRSYPDRAVEMKVMLTKAPGSKTWVVNGLQVQKHGDAAPMVMGVQPPPPKSPGSGDD